MGTAQNQKNCPPDIHIKIASCGCSSPHLPISMVVWLHMAINWVTFPLLIDLSIHINMYFSKLCKLIWWLMYLFSCLCLRTENRSRKTHVFEYRDCGVGWGGVGWGGMLTFLVLRTWYIAMLLRSLGLFTTLHVAMLLRSLVSFTTLHTCCYAAEISGIVYYVTYMWLRCWDLWYRLLRYMLLRCWDLWDRLLRYMSLRCWDLWDCLLRYIHVATLLRSLRSLRAWQWRCIHKNADCQLFTTHALQRWRWKTKKRAPSFSRISNHQISRALW